MPPSTRQRILEVAHELVLRKGFPATTVDEICAAAGVSKGSFYHSFKAKEEMGLALLAGFYEVTQERLFAAPWADETDPRGRLLAFMEYAEKSADTFWGEGCLLGGFAVDVAETNPMMQERISMILGSLTQRLAPLFEPAVAEGGPTSVELAEQWLSVVEGTIVLAKGHQDPSRVARGLAVYRDHIGRLLENQAVV